MGGWNKSGLPWYAHPDFALTDRHQEIESLVWIDGRAKCNRRRMSLIQDAWSDGDLFKINPSHHHYGFGFDGSAFVFRRAEIQKNGSLVVVVDTLEMPERWTMRASRIGGAIFWHCAERMDALE